MTGRSPARLLAPLSLVVTVLAFFMILASGGGDSDTEREVRATPTATATAEKTSSPSRTKTSGPKTYRVKPGDTPSTIAEQAGISLETLLELNPNLDPQALSPGQRLKQDKPDTEDNPACFNQEPFQFQGKLEKFPHVTREDYSKPAGG